MLLKEIRIKRDGKWYANDAEMFRKPIVNLFAKHLERDAFTESTIPLEPGDISVVVEDVPFTVVDAYIEDGSIIFIFHDEQQMSIHEATEIMYKGDTPYITFKWLDDTKISRSAYWMVSDYLVERG
jgi:hypothetical protein